MIGLLLIASGAALYAHGRSKRMHPKKMFAQDRPQAQATAWATQPRGTPTIISGEPMRTNGHGGRIAI